MSFLLDTNVISETMKPRPNAGVLAWLAEADEDRVFLSVISLMELRYGVERMDAGRRRSRLEEWVGHDLRLRFEKRILAIDPAVADAAGKLVARSESLGRPVETRDALIAATAETFELTVVTRNVSDFNPMTRNLLNPWS